MEDVPRRPINKQTCYDANLRVSALIDANGKWNSDLLHELFPLNDMKRILSMSVGNVADRDIWAHTTTGAYSVKSGYWLATELLRSSYRQVSPQEEEVLQVQKKIWKLPTVPKIRMFLWRVSVGALAVAERLISRSIPVDIICKICNAGTKSIDHMLFHSAMAKEFWDMAGLQNIGVDQSLSVAKQLDCVLALMDDTRVSVEKHNSIPWMLWTIWKNKNSILFAETRESVGRQVQQAVEEARLWSELNRNGGPPASRQTAIVLTRRWSPPPCSQVKCNMHANWRNSVLHSGGSWILRDHRGNVTHHARDAFTSSPDRLTAELRVLIWTLQSLMDLRVQEVVIGSDFKLIIEAIKRPDGWPRYRWLLQQVLALTGEFPLVCFELESSSSNLVAREIARSVLRNGLFQSYISIGGLHGCKIGFFKESSA